MIKRGSVSIDLKKLHQLYEGLKERPCIQVGVFSGSTRKKGELTNAELAAYHEDGSPEHNLPARSMLKVPLHDHAEQVMLPFKGNAEAYLRKGSLMGLYRLMGVACEKVVLGAFNSGGYGKWAPLKNATIWSKLKGSLVSRANKFWNIKAGNVGSGILIRTGQLMRAFSSRVRMRI